MPYKKYGIGHSVGAILTSAILASTALTATAQTVTLKSDDGTVSIDGELVSFEGGIYAVRTVLGTMRMSADSVRCEGEGCPKPVGPAEVYIAGSDTIGVSLMPLLLTGFAGQTDGIAETVEDGDNVVKASLIADSGFGDPIGNFTVQSTTSSDAFVRLQSPDTKIGMASRRIRPAEARRLRDSGAGNMIDLRQEHVVAVDSIAVIVHPNNPVDTLSLEALDRIYSGQIVNWSQLGGPNEPIRAFGRDEGSGTGQVFESRIFAASGRSRSSNVSLVSSNSEMTTAVRENPYSIGFVGSAFTRGTKPLSIAGVCGITSRPDAFSAKTEQYPLQRRLYLYNRADNLDQTTEAFLDFATSSAADDVVSKSGFINLGVSRLEQDVVEGRMRELVENTIDPFEFGVMRELLVDMFQWDRLSTTFRFASGSSRLDGKALIDVERLIEYLGTQPVGTQVALVGFTDGDGAFEANRALSIGRAQQVAATIEQAAAGRLSGVQFIAKGYGELAPSACNETLEGKRINRRVEVWIRKGA